MKSIILAPFFIMFSIVGLHSQSILQSRREITPEVVKEFDEYINNYAPSDSAFNVLISWANTHYTLRRSAVSIYLLEHYKSKFPDKAFFINSEIEKLEQVMISQSATPDMFSVYFAYINFKAPSDEAFFALQRVADYYIQRKDWDSAAVVYDTFRSKFQKYDIIFDKTIRLLKTPSEGLNIENLGPNINTRGSEWDPTPSPDGRFLYFSADHRRGGKGNTDIWVSEKKDSIWQKSVNIEKPINGVRDETVDNVSVDGNGLLLSGNFQGSYGQFDIYLASKDSNGWSEIVHYPNPINTEYHDESGSLSPDGKALLFTSDRPNGIGPHIPMNSRFYGGTTMGNMDIYVCLETENGWSEPINLGPQINTPYTERAVYLHPDGKTLYFSSNGHYGLGKIDVFKSVRLSEDSWTEWSTPINLGKEINTVNDDWGYVVDVDGEVAYFSKENDSDGYGGWDLYSITLPDAAKPQPFAIIKGRVVDAFGKALSSNIIWEDLSTGAEVGHLRSDPRDGSYFITLPLGKNYGYYAEKSGFYPTSRNIDLRDSSSRFTLVEDIILVSIREMKDMGARIRVNNIFFDLDEFALKDESIPELSRLLKFIEKVPNYNIKIEGHTDDTGTDNHNRVLSKKRAQSVADYLIEKGVPKSRIRTIGYGASKPSVSNDNDDAKALNRRVEVSLEK